MLVGARGLVAAVELVPENLQLLYAGMAVNEARNVRVLLQRAPGRRAAAAPAAVYAQAVRLDDALSWLPRLDLVKMDFEGHEVLPLLTASATVVRDEVAPGLPRYRRGPVGAGAGSGIVGQLAHGARAEPTSTPPAPGGRAAANAGHDVGEGTRTMPAGALTT